MRTLFVTGNDTGVGKTWVVATLAKILTGRGYSVQLVKPVESGIVDTKDSDSQTALKMCGSQGATAHVLRSFQAPIAPLAAAELEGVELKMETLVEEIEALPEADWRIVEGAGALAVPIDLQGNDWGDLASQLNVHATVLVVEDRLGAIGQARMLNSYALSKGLLSGVWLNEVRDQEESVRNATLAGIRSSDAPLWATQRKGTLEAALVDERWLA